MNDFKWRIWARRVAYFDAVIYFTVGVIVFLFVLMLGAAYIIYNNKAHPLHESLVEAVSPLCKDFNITPPNLLYLLFFLTFLACLMAIFFIRATCFLLSATKSTLKHKDDLNTAIEKCGTWQIVNTGTLVLNVPFTVLETLWITTTDGGSNHLPPWKTLLKFLTSTGIRIGFQYVVGKYVTELKTGLVKRKTK